MTILLQIYTVSHQLTHRSVKTIQIYADLVDEKRRASANAISLKDGDDISPKGNTLKPKQMNAVVSSDD